MTTKLLATSKIVRLEEVPENGLIYYDGHFGMSSGVSNMTTYDGKDYINVRWVSDHQPKYGNSTDLTIETLVEFLMNLSQE